MLSVKTYLIEIWHTSKMAENTMNIGKSSFTIFPFLILCAVIIHCVKSVQIRSFFCSVLSCIRTEYEDVLRKSPYSVQIQENTDQNIPYLHTFQAVNIDNVQLAVTLRLNEARKVYMISNFVGTLNQYILSNQNACNCPPVYPDFRNSEWKYRTL